MLANPEKVLLRDFPLLSDIETLNRLGYGTFDLPQRFHLPFELSALDCRRALLLDLGTQDYGLRTYEIVRGSDDVE